MNRLLLVSVAASGLILGALLHEAVRQLSTPSEEDDFYFNFHSPLDLTEEDGEMLTALFELFNSGEVGIGNDG